MTIDKQNGNVAFNEVEHKYWNVNDVNKKYVSVTTLIEKYGQEFDGEFWSAYKAFQKLIPSDEWKTVSAYLRKTKKINKEELFSTYDIKEDEFNKEQQNILDEWERSNKEACERGTKIHLEMENSLYGSNRPTTLKKFGIGGKFECKKNYTELDLPYGVYPEYLISRTSDDGILNLAGQIDLLIKNGNEIIIGDWKGLPLDTPILTSNGWSTMSDLKVGDRVFDKDGNLCNIIVKSEIHNNPCYEIKFDNSESIIADIDHRWLISFKLQSPTKKYPTGYKDVVMTTIELKTYLDSIEKRNTYNIPKILNAKPLNIKKSNLPLDPYVLGVWLVDGSKSCGIITQATNSKLWNELENRGFTYGENLNHDPDRSGTDMRTVYGLRTILNSIGVLNNKHLPDEYLLASYEDRLAVLQGLMDTDGYYHKKRNRFVMSTTSKWQMEATVKLVSSLGVKPTVFEVIKKYNEKEFPGWDICFSTDDFNPFLIRNQEIDPSIKVRKNGFRNIESIEKVETISTQCIQVDSPSHTYLFGHSLIVTHNTNKKIETKGFFDASKKSTTKMKYPLNKLDDTNFWHYTLQLSTYAWMLQKINPDFIIKDLMLCHIDHEGKETIYHCEYLKHEVELMLAHYKKQLMHEDRLSKYKRIEY